MSKYQLRFRPDLLGRAGRLVERIRGTAVLEALAELKRTDRFSRGDLSRWRDEKFRRLVRHAGEHCPWYKEIFPRNGLNIEEICSVNELSRLPILTKEHLRRGSENGILADNTARMKIYRTSSGGTTGDPVRLTASVESRNWSGGAFFRAYHWWGCTLGERTAILWGALTPPGTTRRYRWKFRLNGLITRRIRLNTFYLDDSILASHYQTLFQYDPVILRGYANSLFIMAQHVRNRGFPIWPSLRLISSTSEKLSSDMRTVIEETFQAPVADQYGCGEVNSIAFECPEGRAMHVAEEHCFLETVDDEGRVVMDRPGRILITDLDNYAMPLIRYEPGDIGILSSTPCSCGRAHLVLREVVGRLSESLKLGNGRQIAPSYWSVLLRPFLEIKRACIRAVSDYSLQIDMVLSGPLPQSTMDYLRREVTTACGDGIQLEWRRVKAIPPVKSGKTPWVRRPEDEDHPAEVLETLIAGF